MTTRKMTTMTTTTPAVCGERFESFWRQYNTINVYLTLLVCLLGCVTNIWNFLVFTRPKEMRNPTNTILTALSVTDFLCALRAVENAILNYLVDVSGQSKSSYGYVLTRLINGILFLLFHTWSINLTLTVAIFRLIGVKRPLQSRRLCTMRNAKYAIVLALGIGCILVSLLYVGTHIDRIDLKRNGTRGMERDGKGKSKDLCLLTCFYEENENKTTNLEMKKLKIGNQTVEMEAYGQILDWEIGRQLSYWTHALFIKIVPCLILSIISVELIRSLLEAKENRKVLTVTPSSSSVTLGEDFRMKENELEKKRAFDKTTRMLLVVLLIFLVTELPFGVSSLVGAFLDRGEYMHCLNSMISFFNFIEYLSSMTSFFVYLIMSRNYRRNFLALARGCFIEPFACLFLCCRFLMGQRGQSEGQNGDTAVPTRSNTRPTSVSFSISSSNMTSTSSLDTTV